MTATAERTHYEVLSVARDAGADEIKAAWLRAARTLHPDVAGGDHDAFVTAQRAFEVLSDPWLRHEYDHLLDTAGGLGPVLDDAPADETVWESVTERSLRRRDGRPRIASTIGFIAAILIAAGAIRWAADLAALHQRDEAAVLVPILMRLGAGAAAAILVGYSIHRRIWRPLAAAWHRRQPNSVRRLGRYVASWYH